MHRTRSGAPTTARAYPVPGQDDDLLDAAVFPFSKPTLAESDSHGRNVAGNGDPAGLGTVTFKSDGDIAQQRDMLRERGFGTLVAAGVSVHFLQELAHCIELRAEAFPVSGLQSLHCLIVAIERLLCQT
jgi:hypothetical protein